MLRSGAGGPRLSRGECPRSRPLGCRSCHGCLGACHPLHKAPRAAGRALAELTAWKALQRHDSRCRCCGCQLPRVPCLTDRLPALHCWWRLWQTPCWAGCRGASCASRRARWHHGTSAHFRRWCVHSAGCSATGLACRTLHDAELMTEMGHVTIMNHLLPVRKDCCTVPIAAHVAAGAQLVTCALHIDH